MERREKPEQHRQSENLQNISTDFLPKTVVDQNGSLRLVKTFESSNQTQSNPGVKNLNLSKKKTSKTIPASRFDKGRYPSPDTFQFY